MLVTYAFSLKSLEMNLIHAFWSSLMLCQMCQLVNIYLVPILLCQVHSLFGMCKNGSWMILNIKRKIGEYCQWLKKLLCYVLLLCSLTTMHWSSIFRGHKKVALFMGISLQIYIRILFICLHKFTISLLKVVFIDLYLFTMQEVTSKIKIIHSCTNMKVLV